MRLALSFLLIFISASGVFCQEIRNAKVSFITTEHVYVRFDSTEGLSEGDTLYIKRGALDISALQIINFSSISCVCVSLGSESIKVSDNVYAKLQADINSEPLQEKTSKKVIPNTDPSERDIIQKASADTKQLKQAVSGRLSLSSYSRFSNEMAPGSQRMRYTFSLRADHLGNSKFSAESYLSFAHSSTNWEEIREDIFNGLKIYNLSVKYAFDESMHLLFGRKINPKISSVGAIDGLQFEKRIGTLSLGAIAGSRPDYVDYSINPDLLQYGMYLGHELKNKNGNMQNTLAYIEQMNHSHTDRRFIYFQHSNTLIKNLFFFASAEVDLYKKVDDVKENTFDLTNAYLSLRYRIFRPLSVGISFSARNNIIYYESYKDFIERLLNNETLQGWRFRINYRPYKYLFAGMHAGYRFRKEDPRPTKNLNAYITYTQVPGIRASLTMSAMWLETSYQNGMIYGLGISKELFAGKLNGGLKYRYVDYAYQNLETSLIQHVGEANLSWRLYKKLSLSISYEGTFEKDLPYQRLYINITQRF